MPTPVRNPTSTDRDRKSARKARPLARARMSQPAVINAARAASDTYVGDSGAARPTRPAARIAAVAESPPTTRWRDEPRIAKAAIGRRIVYRPVTAGVPAIDV